MIEPSPQADPIVREDLAAAVRLPGFFRRVHRVLDCALSPLPDAFPMQGLAPSPDHG